MLAKLLEIRINLVAMSDVGGACMQDLGLGMYWEDRADRVELTPRFSFLWGMSVMIYENSLPP